MSLLLVEFTITVRIWSKDVWIIVLTMERSPTLKLLFFFTARYWDDPLAFKPSRFLKDWPRDAFLPFSAGEQRFFPPQDMFFILFYFIKIF